MRNILLTSVAAMAISLASPGKAEAQYVSYYASPYVSVYATPTYSYYPSYNYSYSVSPYGFNYGYNYGYYPSRGNYSPYRYSNYYYRRPAYYYGGWGGRRWR